MAICVNCGVELDTGMKTCPLCGKNPAETTDQESVAGAYPSEIIRLQKKENRKYYWELSGILAFSGIAICTIIDLLISKELRWSLLSDVSIVAAWVILTLYQFKYKNILIMFSYLLLTILVSLFLIDLIATGRAWFFPVGLPVTISFFIAAGITFFLYSILHLNGLNVIAAGLIVLSVFLIVLESILDKYLAGVINLRWSLITGVSILPVALILFFYYYRLKRGNRLDSFFHI